MLVYVCKMSIDKFISILESDIGTWVKLLSALKIDPHILNRHPNRTFHSVLLGFCSSFPKSNMHTLKLS